MEKTSVMGDRQRWKDESETDSCRRMHKNRNQSNHPGHRSSISPSPSNTNRTGKDHRQRNAASKSRSPQKVSYPSPYINLPPEPAQDEVRDEDFELEDDEEDAPQQGRHYHGEESQHLNSNNGRHNSNTNLSIHRTHFSRTAACGFRLRRSSNESLNAVEFSKHCPEDEGSDILVAVAGSNNHHHQTIGHRSCSDTNDNRIYRGSQRKSSNSDSLSHLDHVQQSHPPDFIHEQSEIEDQLFNVNEQLEAIKITQNSILAELSADISSMQYENIDLKNANEKLTLRNTQLVKVVDELSTEVEQLRQIFRNRGWKLDQEQKLELVEQRLNQEHQKYPASDMNLQLKETRSQSEIASVSTTLTKKSFDKVSGRDSAYLSESSFRQGPGPGDSQVLALSNKSKGKGNKQKKGRMIPKCMSKPAVKQTSVIDLIGKDDDDQGGCFKGFFYRRKLKKAKAKAAKAGAAAARENAYDEQTEDKR